MEREYLIRIDHLAGAAELAERYDHLIDDFDGVELVLPHENSREQAPGVRLVPELERFAESRKLAVKAVAADCTSTDVNETFDSVARLLVDTAKIGASCLNLTIPPVRPGREGLGFARYEDALSFAHALLRRIRLEAESSGVVIALEAATGGCLLSPVELREAIDSAGSWAVGACVDVGRIRALGSPVDWLDTLKHRLHSIRIPGPDRRGVESAGSHHAALEQAGIADVLEEIAYDRLVVLRAAPTA